MLTCPFPIREAPPAKPIPSDLNDPAHQSVLPEPILASHNIQGSILTGFNKNHRILLFLSVDRKELSGFKTWLRSQILFIATADEVIAFSRLFKATRERRNREGTVKSTWMNISFSYDMLTELNDKAEEFRDEAFRKGLAKRSESLGDPTKGRYSAENWLVGGPDNEADVMLMIEADDRADMLDEYSRIQDSIDNMIDDNGNRIDPGISILFKDDGANLPPPLTGHEHFGFLDGVSQPGLRGLLSPDKTDVLTIRQNPNKRDQTKDGKIIPAQGKPGQDLLYPGEFIFGYPRQIPKPDDKFEGLNADPGDDSLAKDPFKDGPAGPAWAKDGSYLVYRRLHQDVGGFHRFLHDVAEDNHIADPSNASAPRLVGAKLVGRWPSGAPVERMPESENPALADDDCKNNNFEFQGDADAIKKQPNDPSACVDDDDVKFPRAQKDSEGLVCPFSAHIRKAYPRDDEPRDPKHLPPSDQKLGESATQTHRLLRRGLPYGPVSRSTPDAPIDDDADRGLQFLAYQTSIMNQFEFVTNNWVNAEDFKEPFGKGGGHDPIIGQNSKNNRIRRFTLTFPDPNKPGTTKTVQLTTDAFFKETGKTDWVLPTAGGYFFAPSIDALKNHLT
jgi:Dyp-type peroxidase family